MKGIIETNINKLHKTAPAMIFNESTRYKREDLVRRMLSVYDQYNGKMQGLSAIQIGYNESCILLQYDKSKVKKPIVVFNPYILRKIGSVTSNEGCLSEGQRRFLVQRPLLCKVRYCDVDGKPYEKWLSYKKARVFCHEYDHTVGVLLQDKGVLV